MGLPWRSHHGHRMVRLPLCESGLLRRALSSTSIWYADEIRCLSMCAARLPFGQALLFLTLVYPPAKALTAQDKSASPLPEYDVASIKPIDLNTPHMVGVEIHPGARVVISGLSLKALIVTAFRSLLADLWRRELD